MRFRFVICVLTLAATCGAQSLVSLSVSPSSSILGQPVVITASVSASATGKTTFYDGTTILGIRAVSGGTAILTTRLLPSGARSLHAHYSGDSKNAAANSPSFTLKVTARPSAGLQPVVTYPMPSDAFGLTIGDFNQDGIPDVVTSGYRTLDLSLGNGDGTLSAAVNYGGAFPGMATGLWGLGITADFDGDGINDLVAYTPSDAFNSAAGMIGVLPGVGNGTFGPPKYSPFPLDAAQFLAVGDFNGDGMTDLAFLSTSGTVTVLLGNGDGTFQTARVTNVQVYGTASVVGDFNGDGKADLVVAGSGGAVVLLGNGDGTLRLATSVGAASYGVAVADLNEDGKLDLITLDYAGGAISVFRGNGDGTFQAPLISGGAPQLDSVAVGDFDGDGHQDLAVTFWDDSGYNFSVKRVRVFPGSGDGRFGVPTTYSTGFTPRTVAVADFDGDGRTDLAVVNSSDLGVNLSLLLGGSTPTLIVTPSDKGAFYLGEIGATYQITVANEGFVGTSGTVTVTVSPTVGILPLGLAGSGWACTVAPFSCSRSDSLSPGASYPAITATLNVSTTAAAQLVIQATVSGGGALAATGVDTIQVQPPTKPPSVVIDGPVPGTLVRGTVSVAGWALDTASLVPSTITTIQVSVDGVVVGNATYGANRPDVCMRYPGRPACPNVGFSFQWSVAALGIGFHTLTVSAANSNSPPLVSSSSVQVEVPDPSLGADLTVWRPGNGYWYTYRIVTQQWGGTGDVPVLGDFDGDTKFDYAVWRPSQGTWYVIPSTQPKSLNRQWGTLGDKPVAGDFDGDRKTDFAVWRPATGTWYILPSSQPGAQIVKQWGIPTDIPVVADFDGDGKTDIAVWRPAEGNWYITLSSSGAVVVKQWGAPGDVPVPADYDGDGKADIAVWRPSNGNWYILPSGSPGSTIVRQWGFQGDTPVPWDYDRDGKTDMAVWGKDGTWYIIPSASPTSTLAIPWGQPGDIPLYRPVGW